MSEVRIYQDEVLNLERGFWLKGPAFFWENMSPHCVMIFPKPVGVLIGKAIMESVEAGPRWEAVDFSDVVFSSIGPSAVLAYSAFAYRRGAPTHTASCSSVYINIADQVRLILHHQS
jgi:hypothetical protein